MKLKNDNFFITAIIGFGVYMLLKSFNNKNTDPLILKSSQYQPEPQQKSKNAGINPNLRDVHLEYIKAELLRSIKPAQYPEYEMIFNSMTDDELEASYLYFKDYIIPRSKYQFVASLDPNSPLGVRIKAIAEKYRIFNS